MADSIITYSDIIGDDGTFDDIFKNLDALEKRLTDLVRKSRKEFDLINPNDIEAIEKASKEVVKYEKAISNLNKQQKAAATTRKKLVDLTQEELIQREAEKIANRERVQRAKQLSIIRREEKNTIASLRAQLSLVTLDWKKLTTEETKNSAKGKELVARKKQLTEQLKRLEKQTGDTRRNVGNYTDSLGRLGKVAARVFVGRSIVDGIRRIGQAIGTLIDRNKDTDKSIATLDDSLGEFTNTLLDAGGKLLSFVAKPLTLLIKGASNVIKFFSGAISKVKDFSATSDELVGVTEKINQEFTEEKATVDRLFTSLKKTNDGSKQRKDLIQSINQQYGKYLPNLLTERSTLADIEFAQRLVNEQLSKNFALKIQNATQTDIFTNKIKSQNDAFEGLRKSFERAGVSVDASLNPAFSELLDKFNDVDGEGRLANMAINGFAFNTDKLAGEIAKTNPRLAELVLKIKDYRLEVSDNTFDLFVDNLTRTARETGKYNDAASESSSIIGELNKGLIASNAATSINTKQVIDNTKAIEDNIEARIKAIERIQLQILQVEAENIKDRKERLLALEALKAKEEQKAREANFDKIVALIEKQEELLIQQFGKNSQEVIEFREEADKQLLALEAANQKLGEEQLKQSLDRRAKIEEDAQLARVERVKKQVNELRKAAADEQKATNDALKKQLEENIKLTNKDLEAIDKATEERTKKRRDEQKKFFDDLIESSKKVGEIIGKTFEKQTEAATKAVESQAEAVERQRERAEQGLENTLKFEEEQLAQRQAEQVRAQKAQENAAKLLALYNLVAAYAQSGDENALQRALVDFALLEGLGATLQGFYEGTENVEDSLGSKAKTFKGKDGYLGMTKSGKLFRFDGSERIVNGEQNRMLGSMSNEELVSNALIGMQVGDYSNFGAGYYKKQSEEFNKIVNKSESLNTRRLENKMDEVRREIAKKPVTDYDIEKATDLSLTITKKVTKGMMTRQEKIKKNL